MAPDKVFANLGSAAAWQELSQRKYVPYQASPAQRIHFCYEIRKNHRRGFCYLLVLLVVTLERRFALTRPS